VPLQRTEAEFWKSYIESEYFNRDKGYSEGSNLLVNQSQLDSLLYEYDSKQSSKQGAEGEEPSHRRLDGEVDSSVDLTTTFGDYRAPEKHSQLLPVEDRYVNDESSRRLAYQGNVVSKYNKHGRMLMAEDEKTKKARVHEDELPLEEQYDPPTESRYMPLMLPSEPVPPPIKSEGSLSLSHPEDDGAFGRRRSLSMSSPGGMKSPRYHAQALHLDPQQIAETIEMAWPSSEFAAQVQRSVHSALKEASNLLEAHSGELPHKAKEMLSTHAQFAQV
jgi:hypothetical protein